MEARPFFSVCVPQYNRTSFLIEACRTLAEQDFKDFELCISDDCSTEGREDELRREILAMGLRLRYFRQQRNVRYDANLRSAIALAGGDYCLLMGNDDRLASSCTLRLLHDAVIRSGRTPGVAIANFEDDRTGRLTRRARASGLIEGGPETAARYFRDVSFVSGVILRTSEAQKHATGRWDGSEMYQMFLAARILASGEPLLLEKASAVRQGIRISGQEADSYALRPKEKGWRERRLPFHSLGALVIDAVQPYLVPRNADRIKRRILAQWIGFTYGYWIVEYRRVQSWPYAVGFCFAMRPSVTVAPHRLKLHSAAMLYALYAAVSLAGLAVPAGFFRRFHNVFHGAAKRWR